MCSLPYVVWPPNSGKRKQVGNLSWGLSALPSPSCPGHLGPRQGSPGAKPHPPARVLFSRPLNFTAQGPEFSCSSAQPRGPGTRSEQGKGGGRGSEPLHSASWGQRGNWRHPGKQRPEAPGCPDRTSPVPLELVLAAQTSNPAA